MDAVPEIIAVSTAREVTDRARAMEALSDKWSLGARLFLVLLIFVMCTAPIVLGRLGVVEPNTQAMNVIMAFAYVVVVIVLLSMEIYYLRRRFKAIAYLLLELGSKSNRS